MLKALKALAIVALVVVCVSVPVLFPVLVVATGIKCAVEGR